MATYNEIWNVNNVQSFRGFSVEGGYISVSSDEYRDLLDDIYGTAEICGMEYSAAAALEAVDPVAFRCGLGDYESELQSELEDAIASEDESGIEWLEFDPWDIEYDADELDD